MHGGQLESRFFARKISEVEPIWLHFGPLMEGMGAHSPDVFGFSNFLVTREIVDFRRNFGFFSAKMGQGTVAEILSLTALGCPRLAHSKN